MAHLSCDKTIILMIDGFDMAYFRETDMPVMQQMARAGFFKSGSAIFPSLTNANNISIACGAWPDVHGVTTNNYYDPDQNQAIYLEDASFLCAPTIFERVQSAGKDSVLLTCKSKTAKILGHDAALAVAAESPSQEVLNRYGAPPPMYSMEVNYWLFKIALDLLESSNNIGLIYIHTTDYPMHMWPPDAPQSQTHMRAIDTFLARLHEAAPDFSIALTGDHGMNGKSRCWDLSKACRNRGVPLKFAVSPVADRLVKHHGGFGGVAYVYLHHPRDLQMAADTLLGLEGVENVLDRDTAAHRFNLMPSRIGDLVVLPDIDTVFGDLLGENETLPPGYRSHGSLYEMSIPLMLFNGGNRLPRYRGLNYNLDLTRFLFETAD